jgi:hypothetical protein
MQTRATGRQLIKFVFIAITMILSPIMALFATQRNLYLDLLQDHPYQTPISVFAAVVVVHIALAYFIMTVFNVDFGKDKST